MQTSKVQMSRRDLEILTRIVDENNLVEFTLVHENGSGIGYTTDVVFEAEFNGHKAMIKIPVTGVENW